MKSADPHRCSFSDAILLLYKLGDKMRNDNVEFVARRWPKNKHLPDVAVKEVLKVVCFHYGVKDFRMLAAPLKLDVWRGSVLAEARQAVFILLRRLVDSKLDQIQGELNKFHIRLSAANIYLEAQKAERNLNAGHWALRNCVESCWRQIQSRFMWADDDRASFVWTRCQLASNYRKKVSEGKKQAVRRR